MKEYDYDIDDQGFDDFEELQECNVYNISNDSNELLGSSQKLEKVSTTGSLWDPEDSELTPEDEARQLAGFAETGREGPEGASVVSLDDALRQQGGGLSYEQQAMLTEDEEFLECYGDSDNLTEDLRAVEILSIFNSHSSCTWTSMEEHNIYFEPARADHEKAVYNQRYWGSPGWERQRMKKIMKDRYWRNPEEARKYYSKVHKAQYHAMDPELRKKKERERKAAYRRKLKLEKKEDSK